MGTKSQGTLLTKGTSGGTTITELTNITGPGISRSALDMTVLADTWRQREPGIGDAGEIRATALWEPDNAAHDLFIDDLIAGNTAVFRITFADAGTATYDAAGFPSSCEPSASVDDPLASDIVITLTGTPTITQ